MHKTLTLKINLMSNEQNFYAVGCGFGTKWSFLGMMLKFMSRKIGDL